MTAKEYTNTHYYKWQEIPIADILKDQSLEEKIKFFEDFVLLPPPKPGVTNDIIAVILKDIVALVKTTAIVS